MSTGFVPERRQAPRVALGAGVECSLGLRTRVKLMDISLSGVLVASDVALPPGAAARLDTGLGAGAVRADLQVRRAAALPPGAAAGGLGAMFVGMDDRSRRSLEDFLRKASQA